MSNKTSRYDNKFNVKLDIPDATGAFGNTDGYKVFGESKLRVKTSGVGGSFELKVQGKLLGETDWDDLTFISADATTLTGAAEDTLDISTYDLIRFTVETNDGAGTLNSSGFFLPNQDHDSLSNIPVEDHIDWTQVQAPTYTIPGINVNGRDEKVKITISDNSEDYLDGKIDCTIGLNSSFALEKFTLNPGNDETLFIRLDQTKINHDLLDNWTAGAHIDHTTVDIATGVSSGLAGGGDISSTRNLQLDVNALVSAISAEGADKVAIYDNSESATRNITLSAVASYVDSTLTYGDVSGPASSTDNRTVFFDGTTGKLIKQLSANNYGDTTGRHYAYNFVVLNNGTSSVPAIRRSTDTNTGIYFPTSDELGICAGGEIARFCDLGLSLGGTSAATGQLTQSGMKSNIDPYYANLPGSIVDATVRVQHYHISQRNATSTAIETTWNFTPIANSTVTVKYRIHWRRSAVYGNYYEGAATFNVNTKGVVSLVADTQYVTNESLASPSFTMIAGGKGTYICGQLTNGTTGTYNWSGFMEVHQVVY